MNKPLCAALMAGFAMWTAVGVWARPAASNVRTGRLLSVEKHRVRSPETAGYYDPTDAPLRSQRYAYDVSVKVGCRTYLARYESPTDFLPTAFVPGNSMPLRLGKHSVYFEVPSEQPIKMGIVHATRDRSAVCSGNSSTAFSAKH